MQSRIAVENRHTSCRLDERVIASIAAKVVKLVAKEKKAELEFIFVDDRAMKKYNKQYKGEGRATDVLSFGIDRREFGNPVFLGQIIISLDTARANAKIFGTEFTDEIVLYVIHGILHLFGYDDQTVRASERMSKKQDQVLSRLQRCKNLSRVLMPQ